MKRVHKVQLPADPGTHNIFVPAGTRFLTIQLQGKTPTIWYLVQDTVQETEISIRAVETGVSLETKFLYYLGTLQWKDELGKGKPYVLHYFTNSFSFGVNS